MYKYTIEQFISFLESNKINTWIEPSKEKIDLIQTRKEQNKF
jgi:hypothetical protein